MIKEKLRESGLRWYGHQLRTDNGTSDKDRVVTTECGQERSSKVRRHTDPGERNIIFLEYIARRTYQWQTVIHPE